jgi:hypothetical protein
MERENEENELNNLFELPKDEEDNISLKKCNEMISKEGIFNFPFKACRRLGCMLKISTGPAYRPSMDLIRITNREENVMIAITDKPTISKQNKNPIISPSLLIKYLELEKDDYKLENYTKNQIGRKKPEPN